MFIGLAVIALAILLPAIRNQDGGSDKWVFVAGVVSLCTGFINSLLVNRCIRSWEKRLPEVRKFFSNHDLTHLVGLSLGMICRSVADDKKLSVSAGDRRTLLGLAKRFENEWKTLVQDQDEEWSKRWVAGISDRELVDFVRDVSKPALKPDRWRELLKEVGGRYNLPALSGPVDERLVCDLGVRFGEAVRLALKRDFVYGGEAWAAMQLDVSAVMLKDAVSNVDQRDTETRQAVEAARGELENSLKKIEGKLDRYHVEVREQVQTVLGLLGTILGHVEVIRGVTAATLKNTEEIKQDLAEIAGKMLDAGKQLGQAESKSTIDTLQLQLEEALERTKEIATGKDQQAARARQSIEEARRTGDAGKLLAVLEAEAGRQENRVREFAADYVQLCREIAAVAYVHGEIDKAREHLENILRVHRDDLDATYLLGRIYLLQGELPAAEGQFRRLVEIAPKDDGWTARSLQNIGWIEYKHGNLDEAEKLFGESLEIFRKLGNLEGQASDLNNLGVIEETRGNLDAAEKLYRVSLEIDRKLDYLEGQAIMLGNLGVIERKRGRLDAAEKLHRESLKINRKLGRLEGQAHQLGNLGVIERKRGNLDEAEKLFGESLEIFRKLGNLEGQANQLNNLGVIEQTRGNQDAAEKLRMQAKELYARVGVAQMVERMQGGD